MNPGTHHSHAVETEDPVAYWERRYADSDRVWSGRVNRSLSAVVAGWEPGRALDLGCGEGGDVLWLAAHGWDATGIELSPTAVRRARAVAEERGLDNARFVAADLAEWAARPSGTADPSAVDSAAHFDLVTASFLQSPVELRREPILRAAADCVAPGGHLVIVSHAAPPPWAEQEHRADVFRTPEAEIALLALDPGSWSVVTAEVRSREATGPQGEAAALDDTVVVARRR